jgi:hypothetical protein
MPIPAARLTRDSAGCLLIESFKQCLNIKTYIYYQEAAEVPGIPYEARMQFIDLAYKALLKDAGSPEEYYANLKRMDVKAIYVDNSIIDNAAL